MIKRGCDPESLKYIGGSVSFTLAQRAIANMVKAVETLKPL